MMDDLILPFGQHPCDPSPEFDPIRSLLHSLWSDTFWVWERIASIEAANYGPREVDREVGYLRGDTDDALQNLARLMELLFAGWGIDLTKRIRRGNSPPYFRVGVSMTPEAIPPLGQHELDPPPDTDAVRYFLSTSKARLVCLDEHRLAFESLWESNPEKAAEELAVLLKLAKQVRQTVGRLVEVLLAGHKIELALSGPTRESLRLFKPCSATEWFACRDLDSLCRKLRPLDYGVTIRFSDRKWQLFGVACVRRVMHNFKDPRTHELVNVVERRADDLLTAEEAKHLWEKALNPSNKDTEVPENCSRDELTARSAYQGLVALAFGSADATRASESARWARRASGQSKLEEDAQITLLRDIFGNPYRPCLSPSPGLLAWNDGIVLKLSQGIYDERAFDRLPILADALEAAGCADANILEHCRESKVHVRGCWVIDLLLERESTNGSPELAQRP